MMLKNLRIAIAVLVFCSLTLFFLNIIDSLGILAKVQLIPSLLAANMLSLLVLGLVTLLFGRIYCSVLCPLGILQDVVNWISHKVIRKKKRFTYSPAWNKLRYTFLGITALAVAGGFALLPELLDPYSIYGRIVTHLLAPLWLTINNFLSPLLEQNDLYFNFIMKQTIYPQAIEVLLISSGSLVIVAFLAGKYGRLYCNTICPAGTLLGILSRFSIFGITVNKEKCNHCGLCASKCKASCIDSKNQRIDHSRCVDCFNCLTVCPQKALSFTKCFSTKQINENNQLTDKTALSRRQFFMTSVLSAAGIAAAATKAMAAPLLVASDNNLPVLPPGGENLKHFNTHCTSCHLCVSKCPNQVIQPGKITNGITTMMQPVMDFQKGYCDYQCNLCGNVCPNQAIKKQSLTQKQKIKIGSAIYEQSRCVVETDGVSCGNCAVHCPVQAIAMVGDENKKLPSVDITKCIGCGSCEYHCPANPRAIHVVGIPEQERN